MNQKVKEHVSKYNEANGWDTDEAGVIDTIMESDTIFRETVDSRRWWDEDDCVVEIEGMLIGYNGASTTGDDSPEDKGWEFDSDSIREVKAETKTITKTIYTTVKD